MKQLKRLAIAAAALALPIAALGDITGTTTLTSGMELNLSAGTTGTSGGDIQWTGTAIDFVGSAKGFDIPGSGGATTFSALTQSIVSEEALAFSTSPIPASTLVTGNIFVLETNTQSFAKVMVTAQSGSSITLQYDTFGAATGPSGPTITQVSNNYSGIPAGFANSGIAPSTLAFIKGTGLAASPASTLQSSAAPGLPKTLNGASISVTVTTQTGSTTVTPAIYYASPTQIDFVLPANTPTGSGTLTLSYNNASSSPYAIQVVAAAPGLDTLYGSGSGLVIATDNASGALFGYTNSAAPGKTIVLWGSGLGADAADSDTTYTSSPHPVNQSSTQVYFGGVQGTVLYAGSSGYPGLVQIDVTIPNNVSTGCGVSVVAVVEGVPSNFTQLPINPGGGTCTDALYGVTGGQLTSLGSQTTVKTGFLGLEDLTTPPPVGNLAGAFASFSSYTGGSSFASSQTLVSAGSCSVTETVTSTTGVTGTSTPLDAGTLSVTGPNGTYQMQSLLKGTYDAELPAGAIPSTGGAFTFKGTGGADVGAFSTTLNLPNPLLTWTNQSAAATITRSSGLPVNWTGGGSGSYVYIIGDAVSTTSGASGAFVCYAPQSAGTFTVPAYVLGTLPAGTGSLSVENISQYGAFSAPGIDYGLAYAFTGIEVDSTYQ